MPVALCRLAGYLKSSILRSHLSYLTMEVAVHWVDRIGRRLKLRDLHSS